MPIDAPRIDDSLLTFDDRPFRWRMGLRPLDLGQWLLVDADRDRDLAEKHTLWAARPDDVYRDLAGSEAAADEIRRAVHDDLDRRGLTPAASPPHTPALQQAALAVQEDLLVMERRDGVWVLTAGSLSFPTNWRLADKIGRDLQAIHRPVPRYDDQLATAVSGFFDRMTVDRPVWRANWSITDDPARRLDPDRRIPAHPPQSPAEAAERLHLRVERQTLRRFPRSGAVLFTVRILTQPVAPLAQRPEIARRLAAALAALPPDVAAYKHATSRWAGPLVEWLRAVGSP